MLKKGQFDVARKTIYWMLAGVVIAVVLLAFVLILADYKYDLTYISPNLKASMISLRFTNIPECFAYQDEETGRVYPGIIDLSKFTEEQMENCYKTNSVSQINFKLKLQNKGLEVLTNNYRNNPAPNILTPVNILVKDGEEISGDILEYGVQLGI